VAIEESRVTLLASTVSANSTNGDGGGFKGLSEYAGATRWNFVNSTFSGNSANGHGGGLFFGGLFPSICCVTPDMILANLFSSTVTDNSADADRDEVGDGGGVAGLGVVLHNTLVAGNQDRTPRNNNGVPILPDCALIVAIGSRFSLVQNLAGCTLGPHLPGMVTGVSPLLGPLTDNGGPTPTHLIGNGPAFNAGDPTGCHDHLDNVLSTDQRGLPRHVLQTGVKGRCDIGSTELAITP
jgi:hypothetical protein